MSSQLTTTSQLWTKASWQCLLIIPPIQAGGERKRAVSLTFIFSCNAWIHCTLFLHMHRNRTELMRTLYTVFVRSLASFLLTRFLSAHSLSVFLPLLFCNFLSVLSHISIVMLTVFLNVFILFKLVWIASLNSCDLCKCSSEKPEPLVASFLFYI